MDENRWIVTTLRKIHIKLQTEKASLRNFFVTNNFTIFNHKVVSDIVLTTKHTYTKGKVQCSNQIFDLECHWSVLTLSFVFLPSHKNPEPCTVGKRQGVPLSPIVPFDIIKLPPSVKQSAFIRLSVSSGTRIAHLSHQLNQQFHHQFLNWVLLKRTELSLSQTIKRTSLPTFWIYWERV